MSDIDEDVDTVNQATFIIPCSDRANADIDEPEAFQPLFTFEEDTRGSAFRYRAFTKTIEHLNTAFDRMYAALLDPTSKEIGSKLVERQEERLRRCIYTKKLQVIQLSKTAIISSRLIDSVREGVEARADCLWLQLRSRECLDLPSTLRLLVTRTLLQRPDLLDDADLTDPLSLSFIGADTTVCILIDSVATFHYGVLNDLMQAVYALAEDEGAPTYKLLLIAESGQQTMDDKIDPATAPLLDITAIQLPSSSTFFELLVEELFLGSEADDTVKVWPSMSIVEMVQLQYYDFWPDLDKVRADLILALHNHFTRNSLSLLCMQTDDRTVWTPAMATRVRQVIVGEVGGGLDEEAVRLTVPCDDARTQQGYLTSLLMDDHALYSSITTFRSGVVKRRQSFVAGTHLAHLLRSTLGLNGTGAEQRTTSAPRKSSLGGLYLALCSASDQRHVLQDLRMAIRGRPLTILKSIMDEIGRGDILRDEREKVAYAAFMDQIVDLMVSDDLNREESMSDEARFQQVQRNLVREESSTQLKRQIGDWLMTLLRSLLQPPAPLEEQVWTTTGDAESLSAMLAPAPRANTLIALNDPSAYIVDGMADAPDISIAFRTYQDAGRMINLADWFNAFLQQAEAGKRMGEFDEQSTASKSNGKRQASTRSDDGVDSSELSELDDEGEREEAAHSNKRRKANDKRSEKDLAAWNRPDLLRTRFALAVHELGAMGFLKRTRRKPEHVMKLIFDLAPSKQ